MLKDLNVEFLGGRAQSEDAVLFVPGYKGSRLVDENELTVWISAWEVLFRSRSLALEGDALGISDAPQLTSEGVLQEVPIIPGIYSNSVYRGCSDALVKSLEDTHAVYAFHYDWRKSNTLSASQLKNALLQLRKKHSKIGITAHSMGGLMVWSLIRQELDLQNVETEEQPLLESLSGVVFAAVPFGGVFSAFGDMHGPVPSIAGNDTLLNRAAYTSFESAYEMFPPPESSSLLTFEGEALPNAATMFDAEYWEARGWGLLEREGSEPETLGLPENTYPFRKELTEKRIRKAEDFIRSLRAPLSQHHRLPELLILRGTGERTLARGVHSQSSGRKLFKTETIESESLVDSLLSQLFEDGDGTVTRQSASFRSQIIADTSVPDLEFSELDVQSDHSSICSNSTAIEAQTRFFRQ